MTKDEDAGRLLEIQLSILELLAEAANIIAKYESAFDRAQVNWIRQINGSISNDAVKLDNTLITMDDTVKEIENWEIEK